MVVAFGLAGTANIDILHDPIGVSESGQKITLPMLWPASEEIDAALAVASDPKDFDIAYEGAEASRMWRDLAAPDTAIFPWDVSSTYIRRPPFTSLGNGAQLGKYSAHPLLALGDDITTDHISPAGAIPPASAAGRYLIERGENPADLNVFASRRGNWEVMVRGLFTNRTVRNQLDADIPAGATIHAPTGEILPLWDAARRYADAGQSVVIVAGERYGMGSSRDWAAKGVSLLGVKAVLALSFERIHRSNLIGMGILPIRLPTAFGPDTLQLRSGDTVTIDADSASLLPRGQMIITINKIFGAKFDFAATLAVETSVEIQTLRAGGIIPLILGKLTP